MLDLIQSLSQSLSLSLSLTKTHKWVKPINFQAHQIKTHNFLLHNNQYLQVKTSKTQDLSQISLEIHNTNILPATLIVIHTQRLKKVKKSHTWNRKDRNLVAKVNRERQRCGK